MPEVLKRAGPAVLAMEGLRTGEQGGTNQQRREALTQAPIRQVGRQPLTDQRPQHTTDQKGR